MQFKRKCLFRNSSKQIHQDDPIALESVWAYITTRGETKKSGRYRIRITKFESADMIALGLIEDEAIPPGAGFAIQGILEQWDTKTGWIHVLDWVGNPDLPLAEIENDLNTQYQAFITGISIENDFSFDYNPPKRPRIREVADPPKSPQPKPKPVIDDFDWV